MSWEQKMTNNHFVYQEDKNLVTYVLYIENATNSHQYEISTEGQLELHSHVVLIESIDLDSDKPTFITETTTVKNIFISNGRAFLMLHSRPEVFGFQKA